MDLSLSNHGLRIGRPDQNNLNVSERVPIPGGERGVFARLGLSVRSLPSFPVPPRCLTLPSSMSTRATGTSRASRRRLGLESAQLIRGAVQQQPHGRRGQLANDAGWNAGDDRQGGYDRVRSHDGAGADVAKGGGPVPS